MRRCISKIIAILVLALVPAFIPTAPAQKVRRTTSLFVNRSNIVSEVSHRAKQRPSLTAIELAAFGNELITRKGFDYDFNVCDILTERDRANNSSANFVRTYQMTSTADEQLTFRFTIANLDESLCGECWTTVPSLQVTNKEMTLIAQGRQYRVRRPPSFHLDEVQLVDETLKKALRTWQLPFQAVPIGISPDGTKLYVDFYSDYELEQLVLEVSENGPPQFRDRAVIKSDEGKNVENHPTDPDNAYLSFTSFRVGEKTYYIKFSGPCT
jgi:hypothetical protein